MGTLIQPGQLLVGGQAAGQLNQYYGSADTAQTTVTQAAATNLSTVYTIPAGEAYTNAAYTLSCGGYGTWGSTQQLLHLIPYLDVAIGSGSEGQVAAAAFSTSLNFAWGAEWTVVCVDGVSAWRVTFKASLQSANAANPGTASTNALPVVITPTGTATASVSSSITVALQAQWASTTGAPTITNSWTTFRKVS